MQYEIIKPNGTIETLEGPEPSLEVGVVGQDPEPAPEPAPSTTIRFRFPFPGFFTYPIIARYPYAPPYPLFARPVFPIRMTLFVRSVSNVYQPYGWTPVGNIEVDSISTALAIARCMGGAVGPIGATAPNQFP